MIAIVWLRVRFSSFYFWVFVVARVQIHANSVANHGNSLKKHDSGVVIREVSINTQIKISIVIVYNIIQEVGLLVLLRAWVLLASNDCSVPLVISRIYSVFVLWKESLCVKILYQNRIVSIPKLIALLDESICMLSLDCYRMLLL